MKIVFDSIGGIGKNIAATVIIKLIKKKYPDCELTVISTTPEVFNHNPNVDYLFHIDTRSEVLEYGHDFDQVLVQDPYHHTDMITRKSHLISTWAKLYDLDYKDEQPEIFLTEKEIQEGTELYSSDKPIMVIHPNGGTNTELFTYNWSRDLPTSISNAVIEKYKDEYKIYKIKSKDSKLTLMNTTPADEGIRMIAVLLMLSEKRLLIDSFTQHLAVCVDKPSTVCWITTTPNEFGYKMHNNVIRTPYEKPTIFTCYEGYNLVEYLSNMPYSSNKDIFNLNEILNNI